MQKFILYWDSTRDRGSDKHTHTYKVMRMSSLKLWFGIFEQEVGLCEYFGAEAGFVCVYVCMCAGVTAQQRPRRDKPRAHRYTTQCGTTWYSTWSVPCRGWASPPALPSSREGWLWTCRKLSSSGSSRGSRTSR